MRVKLEVTRSNRDLGNIIKDKEARNGKVGKIY